MANILTQNPFVLDTASGAVLTTMQLFVRAIKWNGGSAAAGGDHAQVTDVNGNVFFDSNTDGANKIDFESFSTQGKTGRYMNGLKVSVLDHGTIYLYLD